ncbi:MAG: hypothetical protein ACI9JL_002341 [Paracoccaceae bacterium]|jgi:hypothetical protein
MFSFMPKANPGSRVMKSLIIGVLACALTACAGVELKSERQVARERVAAFLAANPRTDSALVDAMRRFQIRKGMTPQQVTAVWGAPYQILKWRNGTVTHWQFSCAWPAYCFPPDMRGGLVEPQRAEAFFEKGQLVRWWSP